MLSVVGNNIYEDSSSAAIPDRLFILLALLFCIGERFAVSACCNSSGTPSLYMGAYLYDSLHSAKDLMPSTRMYSHNSRHALFMGNSTNKLCQKEAMIADTISVVLLRVDCRLLFDDANPHRDVHSSWSWDCFGDDWGSGRL